MTKNSRTCIDSKFACMRGLKSNPITSSVRLTEQFYLHSEMNLQNDSSWPMWQNAISFGRYESNISDSPFNSVCDIIRWEKNRGQANLSRNGGTCISKVPYQFDISFDRIRHKNKTQMKINIDQYRYEYNHDTMYKITNLIKKQKDALDGMDEWNGLTDEQTNT